MLYGRIDRLVPETDGQTDRRMLNGRIDRLVPETDRQTDRQTDECCVEELID